jgi:hypothetical protein
LGGASLIIYAIRRTQISAAFGLGFGSFFCEMILMTYFGAIIALLIILITGDLAWQSRIFQRLNLTPRASSDVLPLRRRLVNLVETETPPTSPSSPSLATADFATRPPVTPPSAPIAPVIPQAAPGQIVYRERDFEKVLTPALDEGILVGRGLDVQIWVAVAEVDLHQLLITRQRDGWRVENLSTSPLPQISEGAEGAFVTLVETKEVTSAQLRLDNTIIVLG